MGSDLDDVPIQYAATAQGLRVRSSSPGGCAGGEGGPRDGVLSAVGVLLPAAAPPPLAVPRATAAHAVPAATGAEEWTPATDAPSGVSAELPGEAEEEKTSVPVGGEPVSGRVYVVETGEAFVGFAVFDTPGAARDLRASLKGFLGACERESGETLRSTDVRATTVDGRPALDARLSSSDDMAGPGASSAAADTSSRR
ncbi:hypothetical protein [Streptomyces sp. NPDC096153]|uniref:hypothetical protein n=1 Tax=Streptomyces sp. NPDC096153 TaxID=3155548 RepID=UPI003329D11E